MTIRALGLTALLILVPIAQLGAAPASYSGAAVRGRVVDAETKQPLAGVHVVTQSILTTGTFEARHEERLHVDETVTNAQGEYLLSAWGPKARPIFSKLDYGDPMLTYFKPGYRVEVKGNPLSPPNQSASRTSRWDGQMISLTPFRGNLEEWARELRRLQRNLAWGTDVGEGVRRRPNDYWRFAPRVVWAVEMERRALPEAVRHIPLDLEVWGVTEAELHAGFPQKGSPK